MLVAGDVAAIASCGVIRLAVQAKPPRTPARSSDRLLGVRGGRGLPKRARPRAPSDLRQTRCLRCVHFTPNRIATGGFAAAIHSPSRRAAAAGPRSAGLPAGFGTALVRHGTGTVRHGTGKGGVQFRHPPIPRLAGVNARQDARGVKILGRQAAVARSGHGPTGRQWRRRGERSGWLKRVLAKHRGFAGLNGDVEHTRESRPGVSFGRFRRRRPLLGPLPD